MIRATFKISTKFCTIKEKENPNNMNRDKDKKKIETHEEAKTNSKRSAG